MNFDSIMHIVGAGAAVASLPGSLELAQLTLGALLLKPRPSATGLPSIRLAVVIPAHNEQQVIADCLRNLMESSDSANPDDIWVVADNCTDQTAAVARSLGVSVLERHDNLRRGKGFALEFAFHYLRRGYDAFVVVDADSRVTPGFLNHYRRAFGRGAQAVQCTYLVANPEESNATRLMDLSLRAFNKVRVAGRQRWNLSVGILGNGFALSRQTLEKVPYTAASVVEDLEYHLKLLRAGIRVEWLDGAEVYGLMPASTKARSTQRARWEGGRLRMIREFAPPLLGRVLLGNFRCLEPLLDLLLLPLSFHVLLLAIALEAGPLLPRTLGVAGFLVVALHLFAAIKAGKSPLRDLRAIASVPGYIFWKLTKLPLILATSLQSAAWVRTERPGKEGAR